MSLVDGRKVALGQRLAGFDDIRFLRLWDWSALWVWLLAGLFLDGVLAVSLLLFLVYRDSEMFWCFGLKHIFAFSGFQVFSLQVVLFIRFFSISRSR